MLMRRLLDLPIRAPWPTLATVLALTCALGFFARSIRVDSAIENLLPDDDPDRAYYEDVRAEFGGEEATVIGVFADDVFSPQTLARIHTLSSRLEAIDGVRRVMSLSTVKGVTADESGVRVGRLMTTLPATAEEAAAFRSRVFAEPLYVGNLVSADATAASILVEFDEMSPEEFDRRGIAARVAEAAASFDDRDSVAITGIQTLKQSGERTMEGDLARFVPMATFAVFVILLWEFRRRRGALLPLVSVLLALVWTAGFMVLSGARIDMGTLVLPPLLIATGVAYAIHIVSRYYQEIRPGRSPAEAVRAALEHGRLPVAIAALTTVLGFASLATNPIRAIRDLGMYSVAGISAVFLLTLTFLPAALVLLPAAPERAEERRGDRMTRALQRLGRFSLRRRLPLLGAGAAVVAFSAWGATAIRVETDYLRFFDAESAVRRDNDRITERLGGTLPIYLVVEGGAPGAVAQVEPIRAIRDLQEFVAGLPGVDGSLSLADYVSLMQRVLNPEAGGALPSTQAEIEQILLFADPADTRPVVSRDLSRANVIVRTRLSGSLEVGEFVKRVSVWAAEHMPRGVTVRPTGTIVLLNHSADTLARAQLMGLAQVLLVLLALMSLLFLSLRIGLLSLVPNVFPIVVLFGAMGWAGIPLNVSTSMIAVIAIGIAVDDTIHYLSEFNARVRATGDQEKAVLQAAESVGRPIVFTSLALTAGFLVVCLSGFQPIRHFGILASLTTAVALLGDLVLTPALLMTASIVTLWDLLYVKIGAEPQKQIPLFRGLRAFEAKIVVLMAQLASAPPGTFITRHGEKREELYVLLSGRVDVVRHAGERVIRSLERGATIGEMGLIRHRPRSADVIVKEQVEYLVLDAGFLSRIQRRHPRIAARVFLNLAHILSDRLEVTTEQLAATTRLEG
jgi:predicted RND superfamily exporter protein